MPLLPVMLNLRDKRCVVIGGGQVALRRVRALLDAQACVIVIAPDITPELTQLPVEQHSRPYQSQDLADAFLVIIATDDAVLNEQITRDARAAGVLVNRTDAPELGDFIVPAHSYHGPITLAVATDGASASAAAAIRDQLADTLDADWITLIACAAEYRKHIQQRVTDPAKRRDLLLRLADDHAMAILKGEGEAALRVYYRKLISA